MNKIKKTTLLCLVVLLALSVCLCACNKNKEDPVKTRADAVSTVENAFMSGIVEGWNNSLSQDELMKREDSGDYIVALGWTKMICGVIGESSLQTVKIQSLANALLSEDGKKLLADFDSNAELLIPLLKEVGFTPSDISSLVYDLTCAMASKGADTINLIRDDLLSLQDKMTREGGASNTALQNVRSNYTSINEAKSSFVPTEQAKEEMLASFAKAKNALNQLTAFAYNMSVNAITDELYGKLFDESGALGSITQSELSTLVGSVLNSVETLSNALTQEEISYLNEALNLVIENFDKNVISSPIYAEIVKYAKYAYMIVDIIPTICDGVLAGGDILTDTQFITDLLKVSEADTSQKDMAVTTRVNEIILVARAIRQVLDSEDFSEQRFVELINQIGEQSSEEYQKAMPLFVMDILLNFSTLYDLIEGDDVKIDWDIIHSDVMSEEALQNELAIVLFFNTFYDSFKETYYKYTHGEATQAELNNVFTFCSFDTFIENGRVFSSNQKFTEEWYDYYVTTGLNAVNEKVNKYMSENVIPDLKAFASDYYKQDSAMKKAIAQIADMAIYEKALSEEEINALIPTLKESRLLGVALLSMWSVE